MKKPETKRLEDMSVSELQMHMRKLGKPRTFRRNIWSATKETTYPAGYLEAKQVLDRKSAEEDAESKLKLDKIHTELSINRHERAKADLSSRGLEPLPNHHCINHE